MSEHLFDEQSFRAMFPQFESTAEFPSVVLSAMWDVATVRITPFDSWLTKDGQLQYALNLMTAHLTALRASNASGNSGGSGIVQSATQGSVSVSKATPQIKSAGEWWYLQTPYGQELWSFFKQIAGAGFYFGGKPEGSAIRDVGGFY